MCMDRVNRTDLRGAEAPHVLGEVFLNIGESAGPGLQDASDFILGVAVCAV